MVVDKRQKFIQLAEKRVTRAIKDIRLVCNLSNKNNYSYNQDDVKKIVSALEDEIKSLKSKFAEGTTESEILFRLEK